MKVGGKVGFCWFDCLSAVLSDACPTKAALMTICTVCLSCDRVLPKFCLACKGLQIWLEVCPQQAHARAFHLDLFDAEVCDGPT